MSAVMVERCMCGDTECPSCGGSQGTYYGPDPGACPTHCEACGRAIDGVAGYLCVGCEEKLAELIRTIRDYVLLAT